MKTFRLVPFVKRYYKTVKVKAENLDEAIDKAAINFDETQPVLDMEFDFYEE